MIWGEEKTICFLYAITSIHAGAGQTLQAVDLPIQREKHTGWPMIQANGIKGALRDWCERAWKENLEEIKQKILSEKIEVDILPELIFGKSEGEGETWAGAITVTDARLLFFPARSNVAPFVHVTCPAALKRLKRDLSLVSSEEILQLTDSFSLKTNEFVPLQGEFPDKVVLEDVLVKRNQNQNNLNLSKLFKNLNKFDITQVMLISDEIYNYLVKMAIEVQAHVRISDETGTVEEGPWYQEYLPSDSVLYFLSFFSDSRKDGNLKAENIVKLVTKYGVKTHFQVGGDFTLGKGICKVKWEIENGENGGEENE